MDNRNLYEINSIKPEMHGGSDGVKKFSGFSALKKLWEKTCLLFTYIFVQIKEITSAFRFGGFRSRLSFIIMGFGNMVNGQLVKGIIYLASQIGFIAYFAGFGWKYLKDITTLGTNVTGEVFNEELQIYMYTHGDNSMKILLFSVLTIFITLVFIYLYFSSIKSSYKGYVLIRQGKRPLTFLQEFNELKDKKFHKTLLAAPIIMVTAFTILPIVFMVLIAFTNFDKSHQPPGNLFTWVGLNNVMDLMFNDPMKSRTFFGILGWTFVWAIFATFSNYILGMIIALMINKKGIKFKKMWRTLFVISIAVPQFVTLMLMSQLLQDQGAVNTFLKSVGIINQSIPFLTDANLARITVIVINMWVGIPYTILITTGILINIPEELYESARIDGATPVDTFLKITMPYMIFITTPYLITQFVGNINNFNVIYLLSRGNPLTTDYFQAGKTDLLITWLYKQTVNEQNYNLAATIGILTFIIMAVMSLLVYNTSNSARKEGEFQ
ncbi:carbohydrate ABC transporter permease [Clostridium polynesiense]|uniref:carbohydrate ABC transporter permease n=1 Tax=Clostridium polynesiense TaxID=1325933 RepID=UPI000AC00173|nr:sugar ABC transporter permease [Clostridium polynesiense]